MNSASAQAGFDGEKQGRGIWLWALAALAVGLVAITSQSLWIDEALTAGKAGQPTLAAWWRAMSADRGSDLQMPLYMIYMWSFAKIFGTGEWALRAANLPWFIAGATAFIHVFPRPQKIAVALVTLCSPFAWYYLDEARPDTMQLGASLLIFAGLFRLAQIGGLVSSSLMQANDTAIQKNAPHPFRRGEGWGEGTWLLIFFFGFISLCGSSLLGMVWAGGALAGAPFLLSWKRAGQMLRAHWPASLFFGVSLFALAGYYLWTLKLGARASDVGTTDAWNLAFIGYELLGFGGLGPGRLEIRGHGLAVFRPFCVRLAIYAALVLTLLWLGIRRARRNLSGRVKAGLVLAMIIPAAVIIGAGVFLHFRVLERHFAPPPMPAVLAWLSAGVAAGWSGRNRIVRLLVVGFLASSLASALSFRMATRHLKDDYRDAARPAIAALKNGRNVWWNAGREGAVYYQVPLGDAPGSAGQALWLVNPGPELMAGLRAPDVVITSKPDVYDAQNAVARQLQRGPYHQSATLPAFVVWERNQ